MRTTKLFIFITALLLILSGCSDSVFDENNDIAVVSREDGSGTRTSFVELFSLKEKGEDGSHTDLTTKEAIIVNKTGIMMINVANDPYAIGYVSLGSLNDSIKGLSVDFAAPTADNIRNGAYKVARPFNIATKGKPNELTQDFINFILSREGQNVVATNYVEVVDDAPEFKGSGPSGKIVVSGSSSVTPIMEKLKEAYQLLNPNANVEIQQSDSSTGIQDAIDGTCDIAMSSRELAETELAELDVIEIALDGIVIVVNPKNPLENISMEQIKQVFSGEITSWDILLNISDGDDEN